MFIQSLQTLTKGLKRASQVHRPQKCLGVSVLGADSCSSVVLHLLDQRCKKNSWYQNKLPRPSYYCPKAGYQMTSVLQTTEATGCYMGPYVFTGNLIFSACFDGLFLPSWQWHSVSVNTLPIHVKDIIAVVTCSYRETIYRIDRKKQVPGLRISWKDWCQK